MSLSRNVNEFLCYEIYAFLYNLRFFEPMLELEPGEQKMVFESDLESDLESRIVNLIKEKLGHNLNAQVIIESIEVLEADSEIRISVRIETDTAPEELAKRYFGLTGRVREALGDRWRDYFPVITPSIGNSAHA